MGIDMENIQLLIEKAAQGNQDAIKRLIELGILCAMAAQAESTPLSLYALMPPLSLCKSCRIATYIPYIYSRGQLQGDYENHLRA